MLRRVALVRTDVSEERSASLIGVTRSVVPSSPILVTLMKETLSSSETLVLTRATLRNIPEDAILHSHRRENLKSYIIYSCVCLRPARFFVSSRSVYYSFFKRISNVVFIRKQLMHWLSWNQDAWVSLMKIGLHLSLFWRNFNVVFIRKTYLSFGLVENNTHMFRERHFTCLLI
jgi:hypothetical protein